jgi:hypothetical protein
VNTRNIPTNEDFVRAHRLGKERDRGLSETRDVLLAAYCDQGLHEAFLLHSRQHDQFVAHLFFTDDDALTRAIDMGLVPRIEGLARQSLATAGRGDPDALNFRVELDTDANVQAQYGGDYFGRLY